MEVVVKDISEAFYPISSALLVNTHKKGHIFSDEDMKLLKAR